MERPNLRTLLAAGAVAVGLSAVGLGIAFGNSASPSSAVKTEARSGVVQTQTTQPRSVTPQEAYGVPTGHRIPVVDRTNINNRGWVDWVAFNPTPGQQVADMLPVFADPDGSGAPMAWWGQGVGWISLQQASAPGFDEHALAAQVAAETAARGTQGVPTGARS